MKVDNKKRDLSVSVMIFWGIIFFFFLGKQGPVMGPDSQTYIDYTDFNGVMPAYPLFISVLKIFLGEGNYLQGVFVVQGIIALVCSVYLTNSLKKQFGLLKWEMIIVFCLSLLPYAYSLPEYVVSHEIMTESLSFSVFYVFISFMLKGMLEKKISSIFCGALPLLLLVLFRSQLLFLGVVYVSIIIYYCWAHSLFKDGRTVKRLLLLLCGIAVVVMLVFSIRSKVAGSGENEKASQFVNSFFGKAMYLIDEEDYLNFEDEKLRDMCKRLFESIDETGRRLPYAQEGLLKWEDIIVGQNENRKLGNDVMYEYYIDTAPHLSYWEKLELIEKDKTDIVKSIIFNNLSDFIKMYFYLLPSSFLSMVFIQKRSIYLLCNIYAIFFYTIYFCLMWKIYRNKSRETFLFAGLIMGTSVLNVLCTNAIMYGMQRYLVYTFGLLYIAVFLMYRSIRGQTCR